MYDLIIIGGASAGLTSAIYAARKKLNTIILTERVGGQSLLTDNIENYPGFKIISGSEFIQKIKEQVENLKVEIKEGVSVKEVAKKKDIFEVRTQDDEGNFRARAVIIASGKHPRPLGVPGEEELTGKGVSYCSICDAPMFSGKDVAVIGGGNAGLESAMDLVNYAKKIYILEFASKILGDEKTQEKLKESGKAEFIVDAETKEIKGNRSAASGAKGGVAGIVYEDRKNKKQKELKVQGVFVNVGQIPSSDFVRGLVNINSQNEIIIDPKTNQTSVEGLFAAGDVTDVVYKQLVIAAAEGAKAALAAYKYLDLKAK